MDGISVASFERVSTKKKEQRKSQFSGKISDSLTMVSYHDTAYKTQNMQDI